MLVQIDDRGNIRDLCAPHIGQYNHLNGAKIRLGVWVDGQFSWLDSDEWEREQAYVWRTPVSTSTFRCDRLQLVITVKEGIELPRRVFHREVMVSNQAEHDREVRLFQSHDLRIAETEIGDTALYSPQLGGMVHFKGEHWFLCAATDIWQWECGYKAWEHYVGTWCDAEDGWLGGKPIEQGSVDSTMSMRSDIGAHAEHTFRLAIAYAESLEGLEALELQPAHKSYLSDKLNIWGREDAEHCSYAIGEEGEQLFARSLAVIRSQCDHGGAVLASNDSDIMATNRAGYAYCWPRDGAHVASIMMKAGDVSLARQFLQFCTKLITPERPYFFQKYHSDGTWGASWHPWIVDGKPEMPLQADETALVVQLAGEYTEKTGDRDFLHSIIRPCTDFLTSFVDENGLPKPSYDLWEERRGIHCNTIAAILRALDQAACAFSTGVDPWLDAGDKMNAAWKEHAWDEENRRYARMLTPTEHGYVRDMTLDSAMLAYATLFPKDERWKHTVDQLDHGLRVQSHIGGYARYEHDYYHRKTDAYPGNPWIITTLWFAQYDLARGNKDTMHRALQWVAERASPTGMLAEQYHPDTGEPLSVSPLTWSHAEFVGSVLALEG